MEYQEYAPPDGKEDIVRCLWSLRAGPGSKPDAPALPDGCPELVLNLGDPCRAIGPDGRLRRQPSFTLVGQITRPFVVAPTGALDLIAVRFAPAGAATLHQPMAPITDSWIDAARLPDARPLIDAVAGARRMPDRVGRLSVALMTLPGPNLSLDARVLRAVAHIEQTHGVAPIEEVADAAATTPRHLQRLFNRFVGVSPKLLARMRRFQRVFAAWREERESWAAVAIGCGYSDQAHLIRDFSELGGAPPAGLVAAIPEFTRQFTALRTRGPTGPVA
jgi:AraC-like DNA-binding protein